VNLVWRLILGAVFIAALVALCWADARLPYPGGVLLPIAVILSVLAADELCSLASERGLRPQRAATLAATGMIVASGGVIVYWPLSGESYPEYCFIGKLGWPLAATAVALMTAFLVEMRRYRAPGESIANLAAAAMSFVYVGVFMSLLVQLRLLGGANALAQPVAPDAAVAPAQPVAHDMAALLPLVSLVAVVKACDIGAYVFGRLFGRHKMSPIISPGKTLEGAAGGVAMACVASYVTLWSMGTAEATRGAGWLIYGVVVGVTGMFGDLAESLLKRDAGRKDSSRWMPGFGGVLDILDSILFAAPVAYLLWAAGVVRL
jgi:phosphatidate cytidylyltransferase